VRKRSDLPRCSRTRYSYIFEGSNVPYRTSPSHASSDFKYGPVDLQSEFLACLKMSFALSLERGVRSTEEARDGVKQSRAEEISARAHNVENRECRLKVRSHVAIATSEVRECCLYAESRTYGRALGV
jgi:hypothetical protein